MVHGKLYNVRRRIQQFIAVCFPKEWISRLYYGLRIKEPLNLNNPVTFTEKLQWLKLYYCPNEPNVIQCADKYAVREYVKNLGRGDLLNDLISVWDHVDDISWADLPPQFVLKCNHGCGYNIICPDKKAFNTEQAIKKLKTWMSQDYALYDIEPHYSKIPRRIICEKYLGPNVVNYNIYCFNGEPIFFSLASGLADGIDERLTYYYVNGEKAEFTNRCYQTDNVQLSPLLPEMISCAKTLSKDFPMVRVDLFDIEGRIVLSELTFTPGGALIPISPPEANRKLGQKLDISKEMTMYAERLSHKTI